MRLSRQSGSFWPRAPPKIASYSCCGNVTWLMQKRHGPLIARRSRILVLSRPWVTHSIRPRKQLLQQRVIKIVVSCGWKNLRSGDSDINTILMSATACVHRSEAGVWTIKTANSGLCNSWAEQSQIRCQGVNLGGRSRRDQGRCYAGARRVF
jgi:hypothetical protein